MPNKIEIIKVACVEYETGEELDGKYIAFAYPGKFAGLGEDMAEALQMAKMRYRNVKTKFFDKRTDATESDWVKFAHDRHHKMEIVYRLKGLSDESVWSETNVDKQT
jgi:hypothetical protein